MAQFDAVNYTNETTVPVVFTPSSERSGKLRVHYDVYEAATIADASTIHFGFLPAGAVVFDCEMWTDNLGTATEVDLAIGAQALYTADAGGQATYTGFGLLANIDLVGYTVGTTKEAVIATIDEDTALGTIKVKVTYALKN